MRQEGRGDAASLVLVTHAASDASLSATVRKLAALPFVRRAASVHARRGHGGGLTRPTATWPGLIEAYRDRLPVSESTPNVTLFEGGTPLVPGGRLSRRTGCEVYLKVEGANPTGSFKDRGMTVAISKAAEEGAQAVICASTGNTSASAAAYAVRAGMTCAVLVPQGKIALGKMAQALVHGAQLLQVDGNFDDCLELARKLAVDYPVALVNSVNPYRIAGTEDRRVRDLRRAGSGTGRPLHPGRQRRQHHRLLDGLPRVRGRRHRRVHPADVRLPGGRRGADRQRARRSRAR